jgi:hypothetical protein
VLLRFLKKLTSKNAFFKNIHQEINFAMKVNSFFLCLALFSLVFFSCKKETATPQNVNPEVPLPLVTITSPTADTTVFVGTKVVLKGKIVGTVTKSGFTANGTALSNSGSSATPSSEISSTTAGVQTIVLFGENERGKVEKTVKVTFTDKPVAVTTYLHNDDKKTWLLYSVKLNETDELIYAYEKDDKLTIYANQQKDSDGKSFTFTYNVGTIVSGPLAEKTTNGLWKLSSGNVLELKPFFTDFLFLDKVDENNLVFYKRLSTTSKVYYYFKKV